MVDDPFTFGGIAAANALSDVYAMGGTPISSLSVVAFPADGDPDVLEAILLGGLEKMREAGCAVLGGHSVADAEIKFGYAVTGTIHPGSHKEEQRRSRRRCAGFHESYRHGCYRNGAEARYQSAGLGGGRDRVDADAEPRGMPRHA